MPIMCNQRTPRLVEQHPNLCGRLRGAPARLVEVVGGATRDLLVTKPAQLWSAQEHAGHLLHLEHYGWRESVTISRKRQHLQRPT
jgi:hypothetical protein